MEIEKLEEAKEGGWKRENMSFLKHDTPLYYRGATRWSVECAISFFFFLCCYFKYNWQFTLCCLLWS